MRNFNLDIIKMGLIRRYKKYLKNGSTKELLYLSKEFLIPIDLDRIKDFRVVDFDLSKFKIKVVDLKNKIDYVSSFAEKEKSLFDYDVEVITNNHEGMIVKKYNGPSKVLNSEEVAISNGTHLINVRKDFINRSNSVCFSKRIDNYDNRVFPLYTEEINDTFINGMGFDKRRFYFFNEGYNPYNLENCYDEEIVDLNDGFVYTINDSYVYGNYVDGVCCYNSKNKLVNNFISGKNLGNSVMHFNAYNDKSSGSLKIVKNEKNIALYYDRFGDDGSTVIKKEFPILSYGNITNSEIMLLSKYLKETYNDSLLFSICNRLEKFGINVDYYVGNIEKEFDLIDRAFYNCSIETIYDLIINNKKAYFDYMENKLSTASSEYHYSDGNVLLKRRGINGR